ncbi:hypothetical protein C8R48DRAFT_18633 [Suillus tomentosus]|nr:hypothetical protein C8R48DRAFT_18633 [Suillus tomentosus]
MPIRTSSLPIHVIPLTSWHTVSAHICVSIPLLAFLSWTVFRIRPGCFSSIILHHDPWMLCPLSFGFRLSCYTCNISWINYQASGTIDCQCEFAT